jgi:Soluble NSF attachment protein, SNAP
MEASKLYIKAQDMQSAVASLQRARNLYVQHGKLSQASRACKELAIALKDNGDRSSTKLALQSFLEAARMFETDSSYSEAVCICQCFDDAQCNDRQSLNTAHGLQLYDLTDCHFLTSLTRGCLVCSTR